MPVTPILVTATLADTAYAISATHKLCKRITVQPRVGNTGVGYIGKDTLKPTTDTAIIYQLGIPTTSVIPTYEITEHDAPNGLDLAFFYVASSVGGDKFVISYLEQ